MIPFSDPFASYNRHKQEVDEAVRRVLDSGWYVLGNEVKSFEEEFSAFHGEEFDAVGVANGTDAISLCLRTLGLGPGDEIITTSHTAVATIAGIEQAGCSPVFADIEGDSRCLSPESIERRIGKETRAIMPVHIYGQPCKMQKIMEIARTHGLEVIEDCSQAHGAEINGKKVGTFANLSAFSCYPTKNLGGIGDGGIILSRSKRDGEKIRSLRQYGWNQDRESVTQGFNSRLDELQAAILRVKLTHLEEDNRQRRKIADQYASSLEDLPIRLPYRTDGELHAMHLFVIECEKRDDLLSYLNESGVGASLHYALPVHRQKGYENRIRGCNDLIHTEAFYKRNLTLPMFPELSQDAIEQIVSCIREWFA